MNGVELNLRGPVIEVKVLEDGIASVHVRLDGKPMPRTLVLAPEPALRQPWKVTRADQKGVYTLTAPGLAVEHAG